MRMELVPTIVFLVSVCRVASQQRAEDCGGNFTQPSGSISSPLYPRSYPDNQDCIYVIQAVAGHRVTLQFVVFKLEPGSTPSVCDHDYVQIRDGDSVVSPSVGIYCNSTFRPKVRSTRNVLWIKFHSDFSVSKPGFEATYTTGIIPQKFLLTTNTFLRAIHRMDVDTGSNFVIPIDGLSNPIAIDYDPVDGRLYWTDVVEKTIRSSNLDGSGVRLVRNLGPQAVPDGLAVDSLSRLIIYTDTGNDIIALIAMNSYNHRVVVQSDIDEPRAIELDKHSGVMYWSDWGATPRIERANYDGTGRKTLVSGFQYLHWPNGLALDTVAGRVYWADGYTSKIGWTDLEGTVVSIVISLSGTHRMFGLDLHLNNLFVADWSDTRVQPTTTYIHRMSADGTNRKTIGVVNGRLNDIHIYSEELEDNDPNGCGNNNGGCDYICVPAPGNTSQCLYPDGIATGHIITSVATGSKTTTLTDIRMTRPVISVTPAGRKVTAGSQRFAAAVNKVLAAISKDPSDINTGTPSISRVNTVVTNFSKDISRIHEAPIISPQLIILVIGCIVVSVTAASCVTFIIVYKRRKRDHNSHTTAVASPPEVDRPSHTEAPPTDIFSTDYLTPVAADSNYEDEEHIYHELHTIYDTFKATSRDSGDYLKLTK
ncbi:low-density lipoprotein receptor-related protein 8-like isoform X3 [Pomacea canaliculata]|uniref:low-density lipoprotein receptor-related protein 8-like isoform X3 n=1 Tax=Pomacea canaliculata TaxID=400727 RepID=UPI000D73F43E|nr:low-density lipoprotein receptor-related protein 8-like isoform X3 [Pomacea canaliculata]